MHMHIDTCFCSITNTKRPNYEILNTRTISITKRPAIVDPGPDSADCGFLDNLSSLQASCPLCPFFPCAFITSDVAKCSMHVVVPEHCEMMRVVADADVGRGRWKARFGVAASLLRLGHEASSASPSHLLADVAVRYEARTRQS
jgi:hypothetical protein